jgi:type IV pilus assembly protein PilY1
MPNPTILVMKRSRCSVLALLLAVLGFAQAVCAATPLTPETIEIAQSPLYGRNQNINPNLLLSLSVEFPTVGAAYRNGTYSRTTEYVGYFNPGKCYTYTTAGYFQIAGDADARRECSGQYSGNFMNWATSSAIDMLRFALTGGDRVIDTPTETVLQRAVLQDDFFNSSSYFPAKILRSTSSSPPSKVTPFNTDTLYITSCANKVFFGNRTSSDASCGNPRNYANLGTMLARVKVCDSNEGSTRTDLCKLYSRSGTTNNYKPVGEMQKNADRVRFGAFGYLNDSSATRYGGVLRAPMKYVGPKMIDGNFMPVANPRTEWNPDTGVFAANPENASEGISGVVNYLNQFGRSGKYKALDPVSELYYESIRYLQGKQPTPEAISNLQAAYRDNYPVYTSWADPIVATCQRNYVLSIADINTHWDRYVPGNTRTTYRSGNSTPSANDAARGIEADGFDVMAWTQKIADLESNGSLGNSKPNSALAALGTADTGSGGHGTYYMAGIAYWAHTYGFRPDMPNLRVTTYAIDVNEAGDGSIGATQRQSQLYLAAKYGGFTDANVDRNPFVTGGANGTTVKNDSEWEATPAGSNVPANWFLAGQPQAMIKAIRDIFSKIVSFGGTISGVALTSSRVASDTFVYAPGFDQNWTGRLAAFAITNNGSVQIANKETWEAGDLLTRRAGGAASRNILTWSPSSGGGGAGASFDWSSLNAAQKLALKTSTNESDSIGQMRLNYLRGDRTNEETAGGTGTLRPRNSILGDIVNSGPVYVAAPSATIGEADYAAFYRDRKSRAPAVYVGANDGMLHAFHALTGQELFAYVPNAVFGQLIDLTSSSYVHRPYVDATPTVAEARVQGTWKTVLASGMGGGAQGLFALDVSDPAAVTRANVLWEFTDKDDPDMGNIMGRPQLAKLYVGKDADNVPQYRWFAITGNGLNSNKDDGASNAAAPSVLFILSLDKPSNAPWQLGTNYWKISMAADRTTTLANGLSTPTLVTLTGGQTVAAYAGDLQGRLWKFVLNDGPTSWNANGALPYYGGGNLGQPLFQARDASGKAQAITIEPRWVYAPGGFMVVFGTGKYYEANDSGAGASQPQNSMYGIYDSGLTQQVESRAMLNPVRLSANADKSFTFTSQPYSLGFRSHQKAGWYFDFVDSGERQVTSLVSAYAQIWFNSLMTGSDLCGAGSGSHSYQLNALTGMPGVGSVSGALSSLGIVGAPVLIQTRTDVFTQRNSVGHVQVDKTIDVFSFGASGGGRTGGAFLSSKPGAGGGAPTLQTQGRLAWREIRNF